MSQERWDVVLRFIDGPLSFQEDVVARGPVVRLGRNPGPGGLRLDGYRGLDERQAVITAYDGGSVSIAPVGRNQVRVAPHENQDWKTIQPIHQPVYLSPGDACHLGPPERGVTFIFVEARRLGVWEQRRILSDASQASPGLQPSSVRELDTHRGRPAWFIPAILVTALATTVGVAVSVVRYFKREVEPLGPVVEGQEVYKRVDTLEQQAPLDPELKEGIDQAFHDFVMVPNAEQADWPALKKRSNWDEDFLAWVMRSVAWHAKAYRFWTRLDEIREDYADVVLMLRDAGLPEVFAAIPYQESAYRADAQSFLCAKGYWQLMPEVAHRAGLEIRNCKLKGSNKLWTPTRNAPVRNVLKRAPYVDNTNYSCRIQRCEADERTDLRQSTRAAIELLRDAWEDPLLESSGAVVQLTILSHNAGYDDQRYDPNLKKPKMLNVLPAYRKYLADTKQERAPDFYGKNITCIGKEYTAKDKINDRCGGYLANHSQHYAYSIVAQHLLAVCYYAQNYGSTSPFNQWRDYVRGEGYCTRLKVPERDVIEKRGG